MAEVPAALAGMILLIRLLHVLAAAFWVGGGLLFLYLVAPQAGTAGSSLAARLGRAMSHSVAIFLLTGAVLVFVRLADPNATGAYLALLVLKLALAFLAFLLVWRGGVALPAQLRGWAESGPRFLRGRVGLAAWIGLVAYPVSLLMQQLIEGG
jgi:putative copper export protein